MKIKVNTAPAYEVVIENGVLSRVGEIAANLKKPGAKAMLFSDSNVFPLYGERVQESLTAAGFAVCTFVFPAGEENKQLATVMEMYRAMAEAGITRTDFAVTLGGGVTGDMGGFAAATFLRGIPFLQVPTTLLAQVDASVGGKTAVDLPFGKNLVGAFHQPMGVAADPETLHTLPPRQLGNGMGEVIKHGAIGDAALFESLEEGAALDDMEALLGRNILVKRRLVEEDTLDTGRRMLLNFGHTFGHALEKLHGFTGIAHGEAVGVGMLLACRAGERLGVTAPGTGERIKKVLERYNLPTETDFSMADILSATALDKKSAGDTLRLILLRRIGESLIYPIRREELLEVL